MLGKSVRLKSVWKPWKTRCLPTSDLFSKKLINKKRQDKKRINWLTASKQRGRRDVDKVDRQTDRQVNNCKKDPQTWLIDGWLKGSDEGLTLETSAFESLYSGQFTLSTQLMKPNYLDWLTDWLTDWLMDWLIACLIDELITNQPTD